MKTSDTLGKISPDLVAALGEMEGAAKSSNNPHFRSKYANLEAVVDASRDVLAKHSLGVIQGAGHVVDGKLMLTTRLLHKSGEWIEEEFSLPLAKNDPQATLAALTYARRVALMAILGMPAVDDDGETAMGRGNGDKTPPDSPPRRINPEPEGKDFWGCEGPGMTAHAAKKDGLDALHDTMRQHIATIPNTGALREWIEANREAIAQMPKGWRIDLRNECEERGRELGADQNHRRAA